MFAQVTTSEKEQVERLAAAGDRSLSAEVRRALRRHLAATPAEEN